MKRFLKAFTLVELLIVIVIFGILMGGLMNFWKPVRQTYVDATLYEKQRTVQDGVIEYLCESTRYADKIVVYDQGSSVPQETDTSKQTTKGYYASAYTIGNVANAVDAFADKYKLTVDEKKNVKVLVINRSNTYDKTGKYVAPVSSSGGVKDAFSGRLITAVSYDGTDSTWQYPFYNDKVGIGQRTNGLPSGDTYMALGGAYYGDTNLRIYIEKNIYYEDSTHSFSGKKYMDETEEAEKIANSAQKYYCSLTFVVESELDNTGNVVKDGSTAGASTVKVNGGNTICQSTQGNLMKNVNAVEYRMAGELPNGSVAPTGQVTNADKDTYIIYTLPVDQR